MKTTLTTKSKKTNKSRLNESIRQKFVVSFLSAIGIDKMIAKQVLKDPFVRQQLKDVDKTLERFQSAAKQASEIVKREKLKNYF